jgi:pyruvate/2-oxoglutarate dehydrogenase complex dihydrolipoamide acyltransferase (E2) component
MATEILMPELGESVHEGTVTRWLKNLGDFVKEDEPVVEIMTDKVNQELQAPASGFLAKIIIAEGDEVEVFAAMGILEEDEKKAKKMMAEAPAEKAVEAPKPEPVVEKAPEPPKVEAPAAPEPAVAAAPVAEAPSSVVTADGKKFYTPIVRVMAKEQGVTDAELARIPGTGQGGRVTKKDLEGYIKLRPYIGTAIGAPIQIRAAEPEPTTPEQETQKLKGMRKMIAEHMVTSSKVPVVSTLVEVDVTDMVKFRTKNKAAFQEQYGVKLTYTPFFIKAAADTLMEFPALNSSLADDGTITINNRVHIGVAVSLGKDGSGGLIVPAMRNCESKNLLEMAQDLNEIAGKARNNSLDPSDVKGVTFTLTNPGSYGGVLGTPMINAPQAGILGIYGIKPRPVIIDGMIAVRSIMNLVLTYDHRIVDGATAGKFLKSLTARLEDFEFFV